MILLECILFAATNSSIKIDEEKEHMNICH